LAEQKRAHDAGGLLPLVQLTSAALLAVRYANKTALSLA
jgi:hypothetical protein